MERGSDKLEHLRKTEIASEHLDALAGLGDEEGVALVDWQIRGIPAVDWVSGSFHAKPGSIGDLVDRLLANEAIRHIHVFPLGIPAVDVVQVRFASERAA